jgi:hypothetical protein
MFLLILEGFSHTDSQDKEPQPKKDYFIEFSKLGVKIKVVDYPQKSKKTI